MEPIGKKRWAIAEGYISPTSTGPHPQMTSHETVCVLNVGPCDARVEITVFYTGRGPVGPYRLVVPAERTMYVRFNDLTDPAPIPTDTDFASLIESDVPIVVQHTRLDSRQAENAFTQYDRVCGERIRQADHFRVNDWLTVSFLRIRSTGSGPRSGAGPSPGPSLYGSVRLLHA